jgi:hypothetical protein
LSRLPFAGDSLPCQQIDDAHRGDNQQWRQRSEDDLVDLVHQTRRGSVVDHACGHQAHDVHRPDKYKADGNAET